MILYQRRCLVTGGGSGIGSAIALRFAEEEGAVWVAGESEAPLKETCEMIGKSCQRYVCDISDADAVDVMIERLPALDVLVCNAAVSFPVDLLEAPMARWRKMLEVNLWGTLHCARAAGRRMIREGRAGRIVMISSILSQFAEAGSAPYGMAKAAINQLTRQLACEWAGDGILVNGVCPGFVQTPMSFASGVNELESDWCKQFFLNPEHPRVPLLRPGLPEEIAEAVLFFANPRNSYCTGAMLTVDGGLSVKF